MCSGCTRKSCNRVVGLHASARWRGRGETSRLRERNRALPEGASRSRSRTTTSIDAVGWLPARCAGSGVRRLVALPGRRSDPPPLAPMRRKEFEQAENGPSQRTAVERRMARRATHGPASSFLSTCFPLSFRLDGMDCPSALAASKGSVGDEETALAIRARLQARGWRVPVLRGTRARLPRFHRTGLGL